MKAPVEVSNWAALARLEAKTRLNGMTVVAPLVSGTVGLFRDADSTKAGPARSDDGPVAPVGPVGPTKGGHGGGQYGGGRTGGAHDTGVEEYAHEFPTNGER